MKITDFKTSVPFVLELLSEIEISPELETYQSEMPSDESLELVKESIRQNGYDQTKPIECYQDSKTGIFYVLRGWTRYTACKELGLKTIPVIILDIPADKREDFVIQDNTARRQMTAEQKKVIARKVLKNSPEKSDRQIASITGLSHPTISKLREEGISTGKIYQLDKTIGKDGKARTSNPKPKTENLKNNPSKTSQNQSSKVPKGKSTIDPKKRIRELVSEIKTLETELNKKRKELQKLVSKAK